MEKITEPELRAYYEYRQMRFPDTEKQAMQFYLTEIGEAMDAYIRTYESGWTRNNPDKTVSLPWELGDCYQMWCVGVLLSGGSFERVATEMESGRRMLSSPTAFRIPHEIAFACDWSHGSFGPLGHNPNQYLCLSRAAYHQAGYYRPDTLDSWLRQKWESKGFVYEKNGGVE